MDYDVKGRMVGLEILNVKEQFKLADLTGLKLEIPNAANVV
ncbi:MAG TPA: hypothetical protein VKK79_14130 [Candidatus Lokiarchaeia archaeon]|nr:hypothetical protein [Candidatus Lokiarchaeia archaeon]